MSDSLTHFTSLSPARKIVVRASRDGDFVILACRCSTLDFPCSGWSCEDKLLVRAEYISLNNSMFIYYQAGAELWLGMYFMMSSSLMTSVTLRCMSVEKLVVSKDRVRASSSP